MSELTLPSWAVVSPRRAEHIGRVVALVEQWAAARGVTEQEAARWRRAALLHDALRDATPEQLATFTPRGYWPEALWHGPAAAEAAGRDGERDRGVLDAVHYHSVGSMEWDHAGRVLYLADYLEPGRPHDRQRRAEWSARVPRELMTVLREVAAERIEWRLQHGHHVLRESYDFWNSLAGDASSS